MEVKLHNILKAQESPTVEKIKKIWSIFEKLNRKKELSFQYKGLFLKFVDGEFTIQGHLKDFHKDIIVDSIIETKNYMDGIYLNLKEEISNLRNSL